MDDKLKSLNRKLWIQAVKCIRYKYKMSHLLFQYDMAPWVRGGQLRGLFLVLFFHYLHLGLQLLHDVLRAFQLLFSLRCGRRILGCFAPPPVGLSDGNIALALCNVPREFEVWKFRSESTSISHLHPH